MDHGHDILYQAVVQLEQQPICGRLPRVCAEGVEPETREQLRAERRRKIGQIVKPHERIGRTRIRAAFMGGGMGQSKGVTE